MNFRWTREISGPLRATALSLSALLPLAAQANLVQNGSFETTTATTTSQFLGLVANWNNSNIGEAIVLPSWYTNGYLFPGVGVAGALPQYSPDGGNWVFSDGDYMNSPITQTLSGLVPGNLYKVSFYQALIQDVEVYTTPGPVTGYWQVSLGSNTLNSAPMAGNGATLTFSNWALQTLFLKANSSTEVLTFFSVGTGDPPLVLLDGINVVDAVPEPTSLAMLSLGALVLGAVYRRRRWAQLKPI